MKKHMLLAHVYNDISFSFNSSTTAPALPFTPSFCIALDI